MSLKKQEGFFMGWQDCLGQGGETWLSSHILVEESWNYFVCCSLPTPKPQVSSQRDCPQ